MGALTWTFGRNLRPEVFRDVVGGVVHVLPDAFQAMRVLDTVMYDDSVTVQAQDVPAGTAVHIRSFNIAADLVDHLGRSHPNGPVLLVAAGALGPVALRFEPEGKVRTEYVASPHEMNDIVYHDADRSMSRVGLAMALGAQENSLLRSIRDDDRFYRSLSAFFIRFLVQEPPPKDPAYPAVVALRQRRISKFTNLSNQRYHPNSYCDKQNIDPLRSISRGVANGN